MEAISIKKSLRQVCYDPGISAMQERHMKLQGHPVGMSPVKRDLPEDVIIELELRRNENYESVSWRNVLSRGNILDRGYVDLGS